MGRKIQGSHHIREWQELQLLCRQPDFYFSKAGVEFLLERSNYCSAAAAARFNPELQSHCNYEELSNKLFQL